MRVAVLVSEAFGGQGGIARFNRDLLSALCVLPNCQGVTALPRIIRASPKEALPQGLDFRVKAAASTWAFVREWIQLMRSPQIADLVICGHIHLLPLAELLRRRYQAPLALIIHGIEAWNPTDRPLTDWLARRVDSAIAVSDLTRQRFSRWTGLSSEALFVVPNTIHLEDFRIGDKPEFLTKRYGLEGKKVLLTLGRLSAAERYKGIDEVLELLTRLASVIPDVHYLVIGEGDDRLRLQAKAQALGVDHRVTFAGSVPEEEKADHYRLADAFVMAGRGEGFGIVFLEAMACGIPVVASSRDGSREAVRDGQLGLLADPDDPESLYTAILQAIRRPRCVPEGLDFFAYPRFRERLADVVTAVQAISQVRG